MKTAAQVLAAVMADVGMFDDERRVAAALAAGTAEVEGMSMPAVYRAIVELICAGHVESVVHTYCHTHPRPGDVNVDAEESLCGMHMLRLGDVETRWEHCYQQEVPSFDEACAEIGITPERFIDVMVGTGEVIEHPGGGYVPGPRMVRLDDNE